MDRIHNKTPADPQAAPEAAAPQSGARHKQPAAEPAAWTGAWADQPPAALFQQPSGGIDRAPAAPAIVHDALATPGQPLDATTRAGMEPLLGQDLAGVRVHTGAEAAESAQAMQARAYTVGRDVVFGPGQYAPGTAAGHELLAHELVHVVQQAQVDVAPAELISHPGDESEAEAARVAASMATVPPAPVPDGPVRAVPRAAIARDALTLPPTQVGTAKTTAPVAGNEDDPHKVMVKELTDEVALLEQAKVILAWMQARTPAAAAPAATLAPKPGAVTFHFGTADVFADTATTKKLKPVPKSADDLIPVLELLVDYGVLRRPIYYDLDAREPEYGVIGDVKAGTPAMAALLKAAQEIAAFAKQFAARAKLRDPLKPVVETAEMPQAWQGKSDDPTARPRTFAAPVVVLLRRLRNRNSGWLAGTYATHAWAEFSVDIFLSGGVQQNGFYRQDDVRKFFADLNAAAEMEDADAGKFAWRALYNDKGLAPELNEKYGGGKTTEDRVITSVPGHGPDNTHIHLDLRPVRLARDTVTGYDVKDGRVRLPGQAP